MRIRILAVILSVTSIAIVLFGTPLAVIVEHLNDDTALLRLERQTVQAARNVPTRGALSEATVTLPRIGDQTDLALYDSTGRRVTGVGPVRADAVVERALDDGVADIETDGRRVVAVPVGTDGHTIGVVRSQQPTRGSNLRTLRVLALLAGLGVGVLGVGALIAFWVSDRLSSPVRRLRDAAVRLGDGDFTTQMPQSSVPELQELAEALSSTAHRLDDLLVRERSFSSAASHQLRTPLAGLRTSIETEVAFPREDRTEVLHDALVDIDRLSQTITELLVLARSRGDTLTPIAVGDVLDEVRSHWAGPFTTAGRRLSITHAAELPLVLGKTTPLRHALDVLIENALLHGAGTVTLDHHAGEGSVTISVSDGGPGFEPTSQGRIITTRADIAAASKATDPDRSDRYPAGTAGPARPLQSKREVSGIGLPLAQRLIESIDGRLTIVRRAPNPRIDIVLKRAEHNHAMVDTCRDA